MRLLRIEKIHKYNQMQVYNGQTWELSRRGEDEAAGDVRVMFPAIDIIRWQPYQYQENIVLTPPLLVYSLYIIFRSAGFMQHKQIIHHGEWMIVVCSAKAEYDLFESCVKPKKCPYAIQNLAKNILEHWKLSSKDKIYFEKSARLAEPTNRLAAEYENGSIRPPNYIYCLHYL